MRLRPVQRTINGYGALVHDDAVFAASPDTTTDEYAHSQSEGNAAKTRAYLLPLLEQTQSRVTLDVGCGVGSMVMELAEQGYDSWGVDLPSLERRWAERGCPKQRFFIVDPNRFELPFEDESFDFVYTIGAIEHVGTSNGHSDRLPDYHEIRRQWVREIFRTVRKGGHLLLGGPNRNFPIDVAHGPDTKATQLELWLSRIVGATVHKTWGENFLWGYRDVARYLDGLPGEIEPLSVDQFLGHSRVPALLRPLVRSYTRRMPRNLLGTGFNPWVMALVKRMS